MKNEFQKIDTPAWMPELFKSIDESDMSAFFGKIVLLRPRWPICIENSI